MASTPEQPAQGESEPERKFSYVHSTDLPGLLESLGLTLLVTTYQVGKLCAFRAAGGKLSMLLRTFDKAMGAAIDGNRLAIATRFQIWMMKNETILAPRIKPRGAHDACFLPRQSHVTGNIDAHEIAWVGDELWIVNTQFSCLCTIDPNFSFVPRWKPPFISELARQDRCHLNGLALDTDGRPRYVTALGATDEAEGWRKEKLSGGCLIDIRSGEIMARGFCMPHSPRVHDGRLWLLDSGNGRLVTVDLNSGDVDLVAQLPGYARGLELIGPLAFVGLSKVREKAVFGGVPIAQDPDQCKCGVWVVDTRNGQIVGFLEFQETIRELFDVKLMRGIRFPAIVGLEKDTIQKACVIAPEQPWEAKLEG